MRLKLSGRGEEFELPGALLSSFLCSKVPLSGRIGLPQADHNNIDSARRLVNRVMERTWRNFED